MKKTVYESRFLTIFYEKENDLFIEVFSPETEDMDEATYKEEMLKLLELTEKYRPTKALVNLKDFRFTIEPKLQEWQDKHVFAKGVELGLAWTAILVSSDFLTQVSVEQSLNEEAGKQTNSQYFEDEKSAREWLLG